MATNRKLLVERMEAKAKYARWSERQATCAEIIVVLLFGLMSLGGIALLNACLPPGW